MRSVQSTVSSFGITCLEHQSGHYEFTKDFPTSCQDDWCGLCLVNKVPSGFMDRCLWSRISLIL
ncbi:hypothetical protein DPMN_048118 [Dreissena polymorpha]|uniref:Uncharacterized protein n=1 Tax=Dreissena polymorpha TaxID=45954 RepID=A0A9D4DCQ6_DREPO|nr:hypothetical protein DPMN_048118 [Dreissena polymorpha]